MRSYVANWKEVLTTTNLSAGKPVDFVSRWLILTRAAVFPMTLTSGLIGGLLAAGNPRANWFYFGASLLGPLRTRWRDEGFSRPEHASRRPLVARPAHGAVFARWCTAVVVARAEESIMSGHSKWSSIKHKKAAKDAKRGKLFTKLIKEITIGARNGGDVNANPRLRTAVLTARAASLPNDTIERAIKKGSGQLEGQTLEEIDYEGYGPGGVAVMARVLTDNRNRTVSDLRFLFSKHGGNLGEANSVAWMFQKRGVVHVDKGGVDEDRVMELALEAGADDVSDAGESFEVVCSPENLEAVRSGIEGAGLKLTSAEVTMVPKSTVHLTGPPAASALKLLEALEDHDDVQNVSANLDVDPAELEKLSAA